MKCEFLRYFTAKKIRKENSVDHRTPRLSHTLNSLQLIEYAIFDADHYTCIIMLSFTYTLITRFPVTIDGAIIRYALLHFGDFTQFFRAVISLVNENMIKTEMPDVTVTTA